MKNKNILTFFFILLGIIIILAGIYYKENFTEQDFETLFFNMVYGVKNANTAIIGIGFKENIIKIFALLFLIYIPIIINYFINKKNPHKKSFNKIIYSSIFLIISILFSLIKIGFFEYIKNQNTISTLYEDKYSYEDVKITFPEQKRNLIYIF